MKKFALIMSVVGLVALFLSLSIAYIGTAKFIATSNDFMELAKENEDEFNLYYNQSVKESDLVTADESKVVPENDTYLVSNKTATIVVTVVLIITVAIVVCCLVSYKIKKRNEGIYPLFK